MSRCELCNFCRETDSQSEYYSETVSKHAVVKYRPTLKKELCTDCYRRVKANAFEATADLKEPEELFEQKAGITETVEDEPIRKDTPALSDV